MLNSNRVLILFFTSIVPISRYPSNLKIYQPPLNPLNARLTTPKKYFCRKIRPLYERDSLFTLNHLPTHHHE